MGCQCTMSISWRRAARPMRGLRRGSGSRSSLSLAGAGVGAADFLAVQLGRKGEVLPLLERERLGSTCLGCGVALPHGRIEGLDAAAAMEGVQVFHAGTGRNDQGQIIATGGRVLNVCATGTQLVDALKRVYAASQRISWPAKVLRRDIGRRVLEATR